MSEIIAPSSGQRFDRFPPHSLESEMCVICSLLTCGDRRDIRAEVFALIGEDDFFQGDHAVYFRVIKSLHDHEKPIDAMIVRDALEQRQIFEEVGGYPYLTELVGAAPTYAHAAQYAASVRETAVLRRIISKASDALRDAYAPRADRPAAELARSLADGFAELASTGVIDPAVTLAEAMELVIARRHNPPDRRIPTGINALDEITGGLAKTKFTMVGADPRVGKSLLIKQILMNVARRGVRCGLVTIEEDREKVAENLLSNQSQIANHRIAYGLLDTPYVTGEWGRVEAAYDDLSGLPLIIDDAQQTVEGVVAAIERLAIKRQCEVVAIDHLHLIHADARSREQEVSRISKALKGAFKRCNVAGLVAVQLNRGTDATQKPKLRNLRDSGNLEADGDCIMLLWREDAVRYQQEGYQPTRSLEVNVAKNKDGRVGETPLYCDTEHQYVGDPEPKDQYAAEQKIIDSL